MYINFRNSIFLFTILFFITYNHTNYIYSSNFTSKFNIFNSNTSQKIKADIQQQVIQENTSPEIIFIKKMIVKIANTIANHLFGDKKPTSLAKVLIILIITFCIIGTIIFISFIFRFVLVQLTKKLLGAKIILQDQQKNLNSTYNKIIPFFIFLSLLLLLEVIDSFSIFSISYIKKICHVILILIITFGIKNFSIAVLSTLIHVFIESKKDDFYYKNQIKQLFPLFSWFLKITVVFVGILLSISTLGFSITPLIASLSAISFGITFALRDSLSNFFAGIILLLENNFHEGDKVNIPEITEGYIFKVGIRTTQILTYDNEIISIPNNTLMNTHMKNFRLPDIQIRVVVPFSVAYGVEVKHVQKVIIEEIEEIPDAMQEKGITVEFIEMGDFSLNFIAKFYVEKYQMQYTARLVARERIYNRLLKENIEIPFPTHNVYVKKN